MQSVPPPTMMLPVRTADSRFLSLFPASLLLTLLRFVVSDVKIRCRFDRSCLLLCRLSQRVGLVPLVSDADATLLPPTLLHRFRFPLVSLPARLCFLAVLSLTAVVFLSCSARLSSSKRCCRRCRLFSVRGLAFGKGCRAGDADCTSSDSLCPSPANRGLLRNVLEPDASDMRRKPRGLPPCRLRPRGLGDTLAHREA